MGLTRLRLLPPGGRLGWTPYVWLFYLLTFLISPVLRTQAGEATVGYWAATIIGIVVFLGVYFRAHWVRGARLLPLIAVQAALGVVYAPFNLGSSVFFVYAASTAAFLDRRRQAVQFVVGIAVLGALTSYLANAPVYYWLVATAITLLVGGVNVHFAEEARAQARLRLAHDEIEHLAAVAERERIARDLHDVLGHTLSLIVLKAELAGRVALSDPARAAAEMQDVEDVARRTLQEVRETIRGYHATLADECARAAAMLKAAGIRAALDVDEGPLPQAVEETLALALREAVTNVVRHSGASSCTARLERRPGEIVLLVSDDGRGAGAREGAGLRGMRDRVEAFGGSVELTSDRGVQLRITMPASTARSAATDAAVKDRQHMPASATRQAAG